jgi:phage terminase large subunit-like protein
MTTAAPPAPYQLHPSGAFVLPMWRSPGDPDAPTRGPAVAAFAAQHCRVLKGPRVGRPLEMLAWQRYAVDEALEEDPATGLLRHRTGLIGVGRQNGKGIVGVPMALDHIVYGPHGSEAYSVAGDRQQARIIFDAAKKQVAGSPWLTDRIKVYRDALEATDTGSVYRTLSSDAGLAQGLSPSLALFDEVHVQRTFDLWEAMTEATGARDEALILGISTAGDEPDGLCGTLYDYGKKVATGEIDDPTFLFLWWEAPPGAPLDALRTWIAANPSLYEGIMNEDDFVAAAARSRPPAFRRFRLNQWVPHGGDGWMDMTRFDEAADPGYTLEPGARIVVSFDGSVSQDATVLLAADADAEIPTAVLYRAWEAPVRGATVDEDWQVPREEVHAAVDKLFTDYQVARLQADPAYWRSELEAWRQQYGEERIWDWPVTNARMGPAVAETYKRIMERTLLWDGTATFRRHVGNAVAKPLPGGYETLRKDKPKSTRKIDAAVGLAILTDALDREHAPPPEPRKKAGRFHSY